MFCNLLCIVCSMCRRHRSCVFVFFFLKKKTAYDMRISDWSSDVCSSDLPDTDEEEDEEYFVKEATVWVDGLDKIHKHRGINLCVDLSATPYYIGQIGRASCRERVCPYV